MNNTNTTIGKSILKENDFAHLEANIEKEKQDWMKAETLPQAESASEWSPSADEADRKGKYPNRSTEVRHPPTPSVVSSSRRRSFTS